MTPTLLDAGTSPRTKQAATRESSASTLGVNRARQNQERVRQVDRLPPDIS